MNQYSIVDFLKGNGDMSSFSSRMKIAKSLGISNYRGTAAQNIAMLSALKHPQTPSPYQDYSIPLRPSDYSQGTALPSGITSGSWNSNSRPLMTATGYGMPDLQFKSGGLIPAKAHEMLVDGTAHKKPLTDKQKRYFGMVYGNSKKQTGGFSPFVEDNIDDVENDRDYDDSQEFQFGGFPRKIKKSTINYFGMPMQQPITFPGWGGNSGMQDMNTGAYMNNGKMSDMFGNIMKRGGIHINPDNKGKFTALKKRTGKSTEELTHSSNPLTRKRAVFAMNAKKWSH